ncbi:hypothetical protein EXIGLDRAFT_269141 [Exidia glandulosa HHB12029]|uniref:Uncharacterized protein n=1 Tax=Exidia glandulosa HHB12029 TaxID=1314781 RepID=A0A165DNQ7_EXIGL|nr:hypothetical protein EXIGLDRAFT_269141 [Exidia glandulosa HHB12029]
MRRRPPPRDGGFAEGVGTPSTSLLAREGINTSARHVRSRPADSRPSTVPTWCSLSAIPASPRWQHSTTPQLTSMTLESLAPERSSACAVAAADRGGHCIRSPGSGLRPWPLERLSLCISTCAALLSVLHRVFQAGACYS